MHKRMRFGVLWISIHLVLVLLFNRLLVVAQPTSSAQVFLPLILQGQPSLTGVIVFSSNRDGNSEIYTMKVDGTDLTRITNNPGYDLHPAWSPDGNKIVFVSDRDGNREIYTMNADGSEVTRLTNNPALDSDPDWSRVGNKIVFSSSRDEDALEIYSMNTDGSGVKRLTYNSEEDSYPSWSPDGTRIAFSRSDGPIKGAICVMNSDGTGETPVGAGWDLDWSPDGQKIVSSFYGRLYVIDLSGAGSTVIREGSDAGGVAWSPDGEYIMVDIYRSGLHVIRPNGTGEFPLLGSPADGGDVDWGIEPDEAIP